MTYTGREVERLVAKGEAALERIARAVEKGVELNEKMLALATEEPMTIEPGPPVCPFCGKLNPIVQSHERAGSGPMDEMVLILDCQQCDMQFIAVPDGWTNVATTTEAQAIIEGRRSDIGSISDSNSA
jgi:hypothetical protein